MVLFFADPKQTGDAEIDLINQCQISVPFGVLDFIDADGVDLAERPVLQTPGDDMFDRIENLVPGCAKRLPPSLAMTVAAPNGLGRACRLWSVCVCRRPRGLLRQPQRRQSRRRMVYRNRNPIHLTTPSRNLE